MLKVGDPAPDFTATAQDGKSVKLGELRGKRVVLRFPEVQGDSYTWSIRRPGTDWRVLHQDSATLRTPRLTRGLNGVRFKLVAQAAPPVYGIVRIRVLP